MNENDSVNRTIMLVGFILTILSLVLNVFNLRYTRDAADGLGDAQQEAFRQLNDVTGRVQALEAGKANMDALSKRVDAIEQKEAAAATALAPTVADAKKPK